MAYDKNKIADLITIDDPLKRNPYLKNILSLLRNLPNQNLVLNLDGEWGSGKTIFCQQLNYLIEKEGFEQKKDIFQDETYNVSSTYTTFYFDAWMNDIYQDPMQALLSELLVKFSSEVSGDIKRKIVDLALPVIKNTIYQVFSNMVKSASGGSVDISKFNENYNKLLDEQDGSSLISSIISVDEKRNRIHKLIKEIRGEKKLLIIIDELDRCKPSFAVEFLELIKHFFDEEKTIFLVSTNKRELSHTVKKYYGEEFNGYGYLSRFFDMELTLPLISKSDYINYKFSSTFQSHGLDESIKHTVKYFNLQLRDINRIAIPFQVLTNEFFNSLDRTQNNAISEKAEVYVPYMIALKLQNGNSYINFINGNGFDEFIAYISSHPYYLYDSENEIARNAFKKNWFELYEFIVNTYKNFDYLDATKHRKFLYMKSSIQRIFDALTMIGIEENSYNENTLNFLE